jgi:hypothetical protein
MGLLFLGSDFVLYLMAILRSLGKIKIPLSHLPTWFFIIGYPVFWLQLYTHTASRGVTSPLPWVLFGIVTLVSLRTKRSNLFNKIATSPTAPRNDMVERFFWSAGFVLALVIIGIVVLASLKPIHLIQEFDCLQYHYTLPRQHLILGSFAHIPWAADDLFLLPVDFALAPFWFATVLPNKIPQLIIFFGLISVVMRLTAALATERRPWAGPLSALVILGTHGFGIQMGTGMLDLAIVYLFLASLDSLRLGHWFLAGVEFSFFFWSKPLMPLEAIMAMVIWAVIFVLARRSHWQISDTFIFKHWRRALGLFLVLSVAVAGPFITKSIYYAGTPFFPLDPGMMGTGAQINIHPQAWHSLQQASQLWMEGTRNSYGYGRGLVSFIKHWWLLGVPQKGVNNAFDYPLGLTYLLLIGPFLFFLIKDISRRQFSPLSILAAVIWGLWWFGPQQSRFLYLPLMLVFMVTIARLEKVPKGLYLCLLISLFLEAISLWGAHKSDMARWGVDDLRPQDKQILELNRYYFAHSQTNYIDLTSHDVAYAQFPVVVHKENLPHTILF